MTYLTNLLLGVLNTEPPDSVNYKIAYYLIEHMSELNALSTSELAAACQVSKASISRFSRFIGLEDFLDLQVMCRYSNPPMDSKFYFKPGSDNGVNGFLERVAGNAIRLQKVVDEGVLERLAKDLHDYRKAAVFGNMQSGNVAFNLQHDLTACKKLVECFHHIPIQRSYLEAADHSNLVIIFSVTGEYFNRMFRGGGFLNRKDRPKIYMITTSELHKNLPYCDTIIELDKEYDYASANVTLQLYENLIAIKYYEYITRL